MFHRPDSILKIYVLSWINIIYYKNDKSQLGLKGITEVHCNSLSFKKAYVGSFEALELTLTFDAYREGLLEAHQLFHLLNLTFKKKKYILN